jgi:2-phospho-L-lactate/phosphoenolpyruvate guanylyltransferase
MPDVSTGGDLWSVVVPVKRLDRAKTRLALPAAVRAEVALAMAMDTVSAACAANTVAAVIVITDDDQAAASLSRVGARIVDDRPDAGLNPALIHGASAVTTSRVAALSSDLPALRPDDIDGALDAAVPHARAVVADRAGDGTTMLAARSVTDFAPEYGEGSLAAHVSAGAVDLSSVASVRLRHDVDTLDALRSVLALGIGVHTQRALAAIDVAHGA